MHPEARGGIPASPAGLFPNRSPESAKCNRSSAAGFCASISRTLSASSSTGTPLRISKIRRHPHKLGWRSMPPILADYFLTVPINVVANRLARSSPAPALTRGAAAWPSKRVIWLTGPEARRFDENHGSQIDFVLLMPPIQHRAREHHHLRQR